ncbi:MAG: hypothetical protein ACRCSQ_02890 [Bacteroidales bacterium]
MQKLNKSPIAESGKKQLAKRIGIVLMLLPMIGVQAYAQEYNDRKEIINDLLSDDTDALIIGNQRYLINKSPLYIFTGYKDIYPEIPKSEINFDIATDTYDYDMNYKPHWQIRGDSLMLTGISLNTDGEYTADNNGKQQYNIQLREERYKRMEKLVNKKFDKMSVPKEDKEFLRQKDSSGFMFASWVSGIYYIKSINDTHLTLESWSKEPMLKLTLKDGKVVKSEKI